MMWHDHWLTELLTDLEDLLEIRFELHSCNSGIKTVVLSFALINLEEPKKMSFWTHRYTKIESKIFSLYSLEFQPLQSLRNSCICESSYSRLRRVETAQYQLQLNHIWKQSYHFKFNLKVFQALGNVNVAGKKLCC